MKSTQQMGYFWMRTNYPRGHIEISFSSRDIPPLKTCALLPVYAGNSPEEFKAAFHSVTAQTMRRFLICIVADGWLPDDLSLVITQTIVDHDQKDSLRPVIFLSVRENVGVGEAINRCMPYIKCRYLARFDADDYSLPDRLMQQEKFLDNSKDIFVTSSFVEEVGDNPYSHAQVKKCCLDTPSARKKIWLVSPVNQPSATFRIDMFLALGCYTEVKFHEDYLLWAKALGAGHGIHGCREVLVKMKVDDKVHKRRGGFKYIGYAATARFLAWRAGGLSFVGMIAGIALSTAYRICPAFIRKGFSNVFLRKKLIQG